MDLLVRGGKIVFAVEPPEISFTHVQVVTLSKPGAMSATTTATEVATPATAIQLQPAKKSLLNYSDGKEPKYKVPSFTDKYAERTWAKQHMAGAFRIFAKLGYADGGAGHISLRGRLM